MCRREISMIIAYANILHGNTWTGQPYFPLALISLCPEIKTIAPIANILWAHFLWDLEIMGQVFT